MRRAIVLLVLAAALPAMAQQPVFRSGVDLVRVDVSVMNGVKPVSGLTIDQFAVTDNGIPQKLESVSLDTVPLNLMLVLDISGSMAGPRMVSLIDATTTLVQSLRNDDHAALMTFSQPIRLPVPATGDRSQLLAAIGQLEAAAATSLNDAIFLGLQLRSLEASDSRPVVLVFGDGVDTMSWLSNAQVLEATRRSGVIVHVVELVPSRAAAQAPFLGELASAGGGRRWVAASADQLRDLFGKVLDELRSRYLLSYYPTGVGQEGWHDVKVTLRRARGDVTARPGYFVPPK